MIIHFSKMKLAQNGFSLLELLVSLSVFALIAAIAYGGLNSILTIHSHTQQDNKRLAALQISLHRIDQDIAQFIPRSIQNQYGDRLPALQGTSESLEFTRAGWANSRAQQRSQLQRVRYYIDEHQLWRSYWLHLDRAGDVEPRKIPLLQQVETLEIRYLDHKNTWHTTWGKTDHSTLNPLPLHLKAIEIQLTLEKWGKITRLFALTSGQ